jgi:FixJ family two-component response regulator
VSKRPFSISDLAGPEEPVVFVIDDDAVMREALSSCSGRSACSYGCSVRPPELLQGKPAERASCLVLDIRLPGVGGLEFRTQLVKAGIHIPINFMTGHGDFPMSVKAMKAGAVDFLEKPFRHQEMLDAVALAIDRDRKRRKDAV